MNDRELLELLVQKVTGVEQNVNEVKHGQASLEQSVDGLKAGQASLVQTVDGLKVGQASLEQAFEGIKTSQARMENELGGKLDALIDAREVQLDVNDRICSTLQRIENKVDRLNLKVSAHEAALKLIK